MSIDEAAGYMGIPPTELADKMARGEITCEPVLVWPDPIAVSECLPNEQGEYQCFARKTKDSVQKWRIGLYIPSDGWKCSVSDYTLRDVTHWLPMMPDPR